MKFQEFIGKCWKKNSLGNDGAFLPPTVFIIIAASTKLPKIRCWSCNGMIDYDENYCPHCRRWQG